MRWEYLLLQSLVKFTCEAVWALLEGTSLVSFSSCLILTGPLQAISFLTNFNISYFSTNSSLSSRLSISFDLSIVIFLFFPVFLNLHLLFWNQNLLNICLVKTFKTIVLILSIIFCVHYFTDFCLYNYFIFSSFSNSLYWLLVSFIINILDSW